MKRLGLFCILLAVTADAGRFDRLNTRCQGGRSSRGLNCGEDFAFFELAPANGAGMGAACACTAITGAKGEAVTFTRTGAATCSPLGLATTGITDASLVECAGNLPRVEASGGVNGLRVESQRSNLALRFIDYANATWADVGTPTLTGAQPSPFVGTYANLAVRFDDNDGAAFEGRAQTVTVTAGAAHVMHCYVKAGTLASATVSLDGTTASISGLSTTSWSIVEVVDASSSGVAISAQALNGAAASDTGTVVWGGCQVEAGTYRTSIIPTVASSVTRNAEAGNVTLPSAMATASQFCAVSNFQSPFNITGSSARLVTLFQSGSVFTDDYFVANWTAFLFDGATSNVTATTAVTTSGRVGSTYNGSTLSACVNGTCTSTAAVRNITNVTIVRLGVDGQTGTVGRPDSIISRVQVDPSPSRCQL